MTNASKKIWFYGDSWPAGAELDQISKFPYPHFPNLIEKKTGIKTLNRSIPGSGQARILHQLLNSDIQPNDIAVFSLTVKTRRTYLTKDNKFNEMQFNGDETIVNHYEDHMNSATTVALLYYMCRQRSVTPYFLNLFDSNWLPNTMFNEVPDLCWIIPPSESVVSMLFDYDFFHRYDHHHEGDFQDWLDTKNEKVKKYIRPCIAHPNLLGHEIIADYIIKKLNLQMT